MTLTPAQIQTWPLVQVLDRIGFNLDGWKVAVMGDDSGDSLAEIRRRHPLARAAEAPETDTDLIVHLGLGADDQAVQAAADRASLDSADQATMTAADRAARTAADLATMTVADRAARTAAELLPNCRWLAITLPEAPGNWEALDHLPVVHRFVFARYDPVAVEWAGQGVYQSLCFGYLLRGGRVPADLPLRPARDLLLPATLAPALQTSGRKLVFVSDRSWATMLAGDYFDPDHIKVLHPMTAARCDQGCDAHFEPGTTPFGEALAQLPGGWEPSAIVVVAPEYTGVPSGIESCPWPTVALISDWNVNLRDLVPCLGAFDLVLGDSGGMQRLRALGFQRVHYWPMYSYDAALHRPPATSAGDGGADPEKAKTIDLTFIGNLNHRVQRERTRWLHRVAQMSNECKVLIGGGYYGADYAHVLQTSRMVFNRSIRGELNLRCYEAPACGALLLVEDTNDEARTLFGAGEHCAYYNEANLDEIVGRYLANPTERARVAGQGTARALASSYTAHFSGLLELLGDLEAAPRRPRPFLALPEPERLLRLGRVAYRRTQSGRHSFALKMLGQALDRAPSSAVVKADLAVVYASIADERRSVIERRQALADPMDDHRFSKPADAATGAIAAMGAALGADADPGVKLNPGDADPGAKSNPGNAGTDAKASTVATPDPGAGTDPETDVRSAEARARRLFEEALAANPDHPVTGLNAAWFLRKRDPQRARDLLIRVAETDSGPCSGLMYPMSFRHLEVEFESAWHSHIGRPADQETEMRRLLTWQAAQWLGDIASGNPQWAAAPADPDPTQAIHWYQIACGLRPDLAETQVKLGEALLQAGEGRSAEAHFRSALQDNSLSIPAMKGLIKALAARGATRAATDFYDDCLAMRSAIPQLQGQDDLRTTYWSAIGAAPDTGTDAGRLSLEGLRDRNYLLFAEGDRAAWLGGLEAYLLHVDAADSACLVAYSADRTPDDLLADIQGYLEQSGHDPDTIPDILIVDRPLTDRQEHDLVRLVRAVHVSLPPGRRTLVNQIGRPLVEDFRDSQI